MSAANRMRSLPAAAKLLCVCFFKNFLEDKVAAENSDLGLAFSASYMYLESRSNKISFMHDRNWVEVSLLTSVWASAWVTK